MQRKTNVQKLYLLAFKSHGFGLIESLIGVCISAILVLGLSHWYANQSHHSHTLSTQQVMDSRASMALSLLKSAVIRAGFWADFHSDINSTMVLSNALQNELASSACSTVHESQRFNALPKPGRDLVLYAYEFQYVATQGFDCLRSRTQVQQGSDVIFVKGLGPRLPQRVANRVMWASSPGQAYAFTIDDPVNALEASERRELNQELFFIDSYGVDARPSLRRLYLMRSSANGNLRMYYDPALVRDVVWIKIKALIDSDNPLDYLVDDEQLVSQLSVDDWLEQRVRALQIAVVVRSESKVTKPHADLSLQLLGEQWPIPQDSHWYKSYQSLVVFRNAEQAWSESE
ncbi:hypothetical protein DBZ36_02995 [Alginatibacterium sediminis]|uniref:Pilus assembly protein PilW n=1 Tax=Alginatibacterium sediminis TaxID=2164068 RepID=A0A420EJS6_9ALTE|nr:PilW family protein [Alginatibacterium sediminis]RKF20924.1 hypothetical protein DBZ36_02995 [Alginatibacterium sediminis]